MDDALKCGCVTEGNITSCSFSFLLVCTLSFFIVSLISHPPTPLPALPPPSPGEWNVTCFLEASTLGSTEEINQNGKYFYGPSARIDHRKCVEDEEEGGKKTHRRYAEAQRGRGDAESGN